MRRQAVVPKRASTIKDIVRPSAASRNLSLQRKVAASGQTAIPKSVEGIPALAPEEKRTVMPSVHSPSLPLQRKLAIGAVNDPLESEADAMADHVMQGSSASPSVHAASPAVHRKCSCEGSGKSCAECEGEKENKMLRKSAGAITPTAAPPIVHEVVNSPGQPLDAATRSFMEPRFGYDFSRVRVHADNKAAESANAVNARAYAVGQNMVFGAGQYMPQTSEGRRLLAHELAHTGQQQASSRHHVAREPKKPEPATAPAKPKVKTGVFKERWHYVAYLDQGLIRLGRDIKSDDPAKRIGTIPWVNNNPGNLGVSTAADAGVAEKEPFKQGAFPKTAADVDPVTRRYAVFPSKEVGEAAIFPVLKVLHDAQKKKLSLKAVLKLYKGTEANEDESVKTSYVARIKQFMAEDIYHEARDLSQPAAQRQAELILNKPFSSFSPGDPLFQIARDALTREEGRLNPPGVEYSCKDGFADNDRKKYTNEQWTAIETLKSFRSEIHRILECP